MISDYGNWVVGALKVLAPFIQSKNNSKEFPVINVIILFDWCEYFGKISTRVMVSIVISLHEHSSCSKEGGVSHDSKGVGDIRN